jgi:radical SAM superfamily enzyme YgiQ (UPF0313 family)
MKILLAYRSGRPGAGDYFARMMPVGLGYINAALRARGFDAKLANLSGLAWPRIEALLRRERPDLLGLTLYTFNRHAGLRLARAAKAARPSCFVVAGGPHAAHLPRSLLASCPALDAVAAGEGESLMVDLARALAGGGDARSVPGLHLRDGDGSVFTGLRDPIANLDAFPFPAPYYEGLHLDVAAESGFIITSRGCPGRCTFCNTPDFWGTRMRFRSAASVVEEIRFLARERGILYVSIRDDTFTVHKRRLLDLCGRLQEARLGVLWNCQSRVNAVDQERLDAMRRAGCEVVQYGLEGGSPRLLARLAKDITPDQARAAAAATRRAGMHLSVYLISAVPGETDEDFEATRRLLREMRPHDAIVAPLAIYPGTALWEERKAAAGLDDAYWTAERRDALYAMPAAARRRSHARMARLCREAMAGGARGRGLGASSTAPLADPEAGGPSGLVHGADAASAGEGSEQTPGSAYTRADLEAHKRRHPGAFAPILSSGLAHEAAGDAGSALKEYAEILKLEPSNPWALIRSAAVLAACGDPDGARLYAEALTRAHPRHAPGHALLAEVHLAAGRRAQARAAARAAAGLDPRDASAARLLRSLRA